MEHSLFNVCVESILILILCQHCIRSRVNQNYFIPLVRVITVDKFYLYNT